MPCVVVEGTDILAGYQATREAVDRGIRGDGPTLIEAKVERYLPHTSDDDDTRYRSKEELEEARKHDPLKLLHDYLTDEGILTDEVYRRFTEQAKTQFNQPTEQAESAHYP